MWKVSIGSWVIGAIGRNYTSQGQNPRLALMQYRQHAMMQNASHILKGFIVFRILTIVWTVARCEGQMPRLIFVESAAASH